MCPPYSSGLRDSRDPTPLGYQIPAPAGRAAIGNLRDYAGGTYSIVARDPDSGAFGVAVQSNYFGGGAVVPWVEAGVGAVATQASAEVSYGPGGCERIRQGEIANAPLSSLDTRAEGGA